MDFKELEKVACLLFLFGVAAPVLGILVTGRPTLQQLVFAGMCFLIPSGIFKPEEWGLTLSSLDVGVNFYRGHATGYHFYFVEAVALTLVIAAACENWREFRFLPPGLWLYFLHCALCFVSIINAPSPNFVCMAAFKAVKVAVVFVAGYHFFRTRENIRFFLVTMGAVITVQLVAALRERYLLGVYQVTGTFEHQNSLSMFATMIGMVFLAAALAPKERWSNLYLLAYFACAAIVESTFSRAGMVIFAAGSAALGFLSLVDKFTKRRVYLVGFLGLAAAIGLALSLDTIRGRFEDYGNDASGKVRELLNQAARDMVHDYPLGIGWNNFAFVINRPFPYGRIIDQWELEGGVTIDPHHQKGLVESIYFLLLAETGWQGLTSFVLFMGLFLWWNLRSAWLYRYDLVGSISLGILFGCGCNYLQSTLERVLIQPRNQELWFLLLALTARIHIWRKAEAACRRQEQQLPAVVEPEPAVLA